MNFLTDKILRHFHMDLSLNSIRYFIGGASTSWPSPYLSGFNSLCYASYLRSSLSFPVASGLLSISSLKQILTIACVITKKKQIVKAIRGCCISIRHVPMTQPMALPIALKTVAIVVISPRPLTISFLLCSTSKVSFRETMIKPNKQSQMSEAKNKWAVFATSVNIATRHMAWPSPQKNRMYRLLLIILRSIQRQTGNRRKTTIWRMTSND